MNIKRAVGVLLLIIGIFVIFYANYLKTEIVTKGNQAYQKIDQGNSMMQGNPYSEAFGGMMTKSLKKKTAAELARYNQIVQYMLIGGIIVAVIGGWMVLFCHKSTKRKKK